MDDVPAASAGVPHIVVDKIIDCKVTEESGEMFYCIKWEDTWVSESVMNYMFPDLIQGYKGKIQRPPDEIVDKSPALYDLDSVNNILCNNIDNTRLLSALNLEGMSNIASVGKTHDSFEALNLNTTDLELCQLLHQRALLETLDSDIVKVEPLRSEDDSSVSTNKRTKKPSAKLIANKELKENDDVATDKITSTVQYRKRRCKISRQQRNEAKKNKSTSNSDLVNCEICGKSLRSKRLESHMLLHTRDSKFSCDICGKVCGTKSDLENHKLIHGEYNYHCKYCSQKFKQPAPYRVHLRMHTVENNWMCDICFATFKFQGELKEHCLQEHALIGKNPQQCCICKEMLKSWNSVYKHSVGHSGVRPHECQLCQKKFKHKSHLEKHMKMHERMEREKDEPNMLSGPFHCEICGREFPHLQSIKIHLGKHKANDENNLQEYIEKRALRIAASKERSRHRSKVYKAKYKESKEKNKDPNEQAKEADARKLKLLQSIDIDPLIAKSLTFVHHTNTVIEKVQQEIHDTAASTMTTTHSLTTAPSDPSILSTVNSGSGELKATMVGSNVVLGDYVVTDPTAVIMGATDEISELNVVENMAPNFSLLSFIKQNTKS